MSHFAPLSQKPWETPELTGINRLPARATLFPYESSRAALRGDPGTSQRENDPSHTLKKADSPLQ